MTPYLKDIIHKCQKALKENNTSLFKIYRYVIESIVKEKQLNTISTIKASSNILKTLIQRNGGRSAKRFVAKTGC